MFFHSYSASVYTRPPPARVFVMSPVKVCDAVKGGIRAAARLLVAIKSEDLRSKTAEKHCKIIIDALAGSVGLRLFEAADLSELVSNAGFDEAIETAILTAIMESTDDGIGDAESGSKHQNYRTLCNYLPEGVCGTHAALILMRCATMRSCWASATPTSQRLQ